MGQAGRSNRPGGRGNKARKLALIVADAIASGADTLVTAGAVQSNHVRQAAAAAAVTGLRAEVIVAEERSEPEYLSSGNLLLDELLGAVVHVVPAGTDLVTASQQLAADIRTTDRRPYVVPIGGSNPLGALSYAYCATEIWDDAARAGVTFQTMILATGSGGTQAGLIAGFLGRPAAPEVLGVCVSADADTQRSKVFPLIAPTLKLLGKQASAGPRLVKLDDGFLGPGYGVPTPDMVDAVRLAARTEGLLLDPVYTGKAMAGLLARARAGQLHGDVLFLHTGGSTALFGYGSAFHTAEPAAPN
jgi:1-aminocyclopropane-1-carboxylate deaminase/D-cysteine desulfhydrase-like pyridoxal-dependent ACC family enzyme